MPKRPCRRLANLGMASKHANRRVGPPRTLPRIPATFPNYLRWYPSCIHSYPLPSLVSRIFPWYYSLLSVKLDFPPTCMARCCCGLIRLDKPHRATKRTPLMSPSVPNLPMGLLYLLQRCDMLRSHKFRTNGERRSQIWRRLQPRCDSFHPHLDQRCQSDIYQ